MQSIEQIVRSHLPRTKTSGEWTSHDAVCCAHRGESPDRRGRGGIKFNSDGSFGIHCFNCGFSTGWRPGQLLGFKLKKWLSWLGVDATVIAALNLWCLDQRNDAVIQEELERRSVDLKRYALPPNAVPLDQCEDARIAQYLTDRGIDIERYPFYYSSERTADLSNRVIVPFYYQRQLVGYTARSIMPTQRVKYYMQADAGNLVFNLDRQNYERRVVVVCEGPFDALSIDGVAVMHNEISSTQAQLIHDLHKQTIIVPDGDAAGFKLIQSALEYEFSVSFPNYLETCKDINEAAVRFGAVYVVKDILANTETNPTRIRLRAKKFQSQFK